MQLEVEKSNSEGVKNYIFDTRGVGKGINMLRM